MSKNRLIFFQYLVIKDPELMLIEKKNQNQTVTVHTLKMWPIYPKNI